MNRNKCIHTKKQSTQFFYSCLNLLGEDGNGRTWAELEGYCGGGWGKYWRGSLVLPAMNFRKDPSTIRFSLSSPWSSSRCLICLLSFSSASLRNLNFGGGEDLSLLKPISVDASKRGLKLNPFCSISKAEDFTCGEPKGLMKGVRFMSTFLKLRSPFDLPSSDSKSSFVSSLIVKRNLGGPERLWSLISSASTPSSPPRTRPGFWWLGASLANPSSGSGPSLVESVIGKGERLLQQKNKWLLNSLWEWWWVRWESSAIWVWEEKVSLFFFHQRR